MSAPEPEAASSPHVAASGDVGGTRSAKHAMRLEGITKRFPGVVALDGVGFELAPGEVHAVVGENGAGKSTLMAIAAGALAPDAGAVEIGGVALGDPSPARAAEAGLAVVYQHPALLPDLTVAENLAFAMPRGHRPPLRRAAAFAREKLAAMEASIDPLRRVGDLDVTERHLVELSKALALKPRVLILDEPTEPLRAHEVELLFAKVRELAAAGTGIVYISHRLQEVKAISDRLTVLRDGRTRGTFAADEVEEDEIVALIVGGDLDAAFPERAPIADAAPVALELRGFSGTPAFEDVDLRVRRGEVIGLAGVDGNGQHEFIRALAGLHSSSGELLLGDGVSPERVDVGSPVKAAAGGIAYVSDDRHGEGLLMPLSVRENAAASALTRFAPAGFVQRTRERVAVAEETRALDVRAASLETPVASLSGGNQQKVALARALLSEPRVLLADQPTSGVDVGARAQIYAILRDAARDGTPVIVRSSDAVELAGLCDRVLIFSRGHVVSELSGAQLTEDAITGAALRSTTQRRHAEESAASARRARVNRFLSGDYAPSVVLALLVLALLVVTGAKDDAYLSGVSLSGMLTLLTVLAFIALGQQMAMLIGGIDLSVGPLAGFAVVVGSFFVTEGVGAGGTALGFLAMFGACAAVGLVNFALARWIGMSPVIATLVTFTMLQGLGLLLRETPDGVIDTSVATALGTTVGFVPIAFLIVCGLALLLEFGLRRTRLGLELRAVGSDPEAAHALGARVERMNVLAYVGCSTLTFLGAVLLMAQVGIGDSTAGSTFTLSSITAVVLGGASIFGGRGSFLGALLGAALVQCATTATTFLGLTPPWVYWLIGLLTLVAAGTFSVARRRAGSASAAVV